MLLSTSLIVLAGDDSLVMVVRRIPGVYAVGTVDELEVVKLPVLGILDVEDASVLVGQRAADLSRGAGRCMTPCQTAVIVQTG